MCPFDSMKCNVSSLDHARGYGSVIDVLRVVVDGRDDQW
jgi:hypothetical protein